MAEEADRIVEEAAGAVDSVRRHRPETGDEASGRRSRMEVVDMGVAEATGHTDRLVGTRFSMMVSMLREQAPPWNPDRIRKKRLQCSLNALFA